MGKPTFNELPRNRGFGADGDLWYQDADGYWQRLQRPDDYAAQQAAGTPYVLTYNPITGEPWAAPATLTLVEAFGYGTGYGLGYGRS